MDVVAAGTSPKGLKWVEYNVPLSEQGPTYHLLHVVDKGRQFSASWEEAWGFYGRLEALSDLEWFITDFHDFGCGYANHQFVGIDPADPTKKAACTKCGAMKKLNMIHDPERITIPALSEAAVASFLAAWDEHSTPKE